MQAERNAQAVGCLVIGDDMSGEGAISGLCAFLKERGAAASVFSSHQPPALHSELQRAYQAIRRQRAISAIVAAGAGCDAALALAGQLPVDRLALLTGVGPDGSTENDSLAGPLRRIRAYARRGEALCVSDVLVVQAGDAPRHLRLEYLAEALVNCRVCGVKLPSGTWANRKENIKMGFYRFLVDGVLPKSLAESAEMCIIYG